MRRLQGQLHLIAGEETYTHTRTHADTHICTSCVERYLLEGEDELITHQLAKKEMGWASYIKQNISEWISAPFVFELELQD